MSDQPVILIVDDDPLICMALCRTLESTGSYQIHSFTDPNLAVSALAGVVVDLCITDVHMPGITGPELATRLRERQSDLPLLFISGMEDAFDLIALQFPDDEKMVFLRKPVKPERLIQLTAKLLNR